MISLSVPNRTDDHIRDIFAGQLLQVSDTFKKGVPQHRFDAHKTHQTAHCNQRGVACHHRIPHLPFDLMESA